jgi:hypothetical protein
MDDKFMMTMAKGNRLGDVGHEKERIANREQLTYLNHARDESALLDTAKPPGNLCS